MSRNVLSKIKKFTCSFQRYSERKMPYSDDPHKGKVLSDSADMPDALGESVGLSRWDLLAREQGIT
ncbi:hypothetical protein A3Q56_01993, partial [Intoshia linei]